MDLSIMPECYADTLMIQTLVPPKIKYNHKHSCSQVEKEMVKGKLKDKFAVGIIDKDKKSIKYLNEFKEIDRVQDSLILWRHKSNDKHHFIIQIQPALEKWILSICATENIIIEGMPIEIEELKKYTKKQSSLDNEILKVVFLMMSEKNENKSIKKLKGWIKILKEKNYKADINELINV